MVLLTDAFPTEATLPSLVARLLTACWLDCWLLAKYIAQWTMHTIIRSWHLVCTVHCYTSSVHVMKTYQPISHKLWQLAGPIRCNMQLQFCCPYQLPSSMYLGSCTPGSEPSAPHENKGAFSLIGTLCVSTGDVTMGFAVAQVVDRLREPTEPLPRRKCAPDIPDGTSSTALLTTLACWRETLGLKDLEMSLKDKGGYELWTLPQLWEELRARKARVSGCKKELIERCVPDRVILTVGNIHLNHVNECYCFVTKAQLCGAPPTEWVSGEPHRNPFWDGLLPLCSTYTTCCLKCGWTGVCTMQYPSLHSSSEFTPLINYTPRGPWLGCRNRMRPGQKQCANGMACKEHW